MSRLRSRSPVLGLMCVFAAASIAAGWQVATRAGLMTGNLTPIDLALFRYGVPALVLLPLLLRSGLWPSSASPLLSMPLLIGGGLPFGLLAMAGAQLAPVAHMGALLPGTMPLFTALLARLLLAERLSRRQVSGFIVVSLGIVLITHQSLTDLGSNTLAGDALFLLAALTWAVFTVAFRMASITPWHSAALVSVLSVAIAVPLWFAAGTERLLIASMDDLLWLLVVQGLIAGLAGFWTFAAAVRHLGALGATMSGALVPILSALGGGLFLSEVPGPTVLLGIVATVFGIIIIAWPHGQGSIPRVLVKLSGRRA